MARAFKSTSRGITGALHAPERKLLRKLIDDVITLLEERAELHQLPEDADPLFALTGIQPAGRELPEPSDPAVKLLLPDASEDPVLAAEHRRLSEADLISAKTGALREAKLHLETDRLLFDVPAAQRFARALNDVRLVLSERLSIRDEQDSQRVAEIVDAAQVQSAEEYLALAYNLITWVQDSLMNALLDAEF